MVVISRILVINEDVNLGKSMALIFNHAGYGTSTASSLGNAMQQIRSGQYRLAVLDNNMTDFNTVLLPEILRGYPEIALVVLMDPTVANAGLDDQLLSAHFLVKPVAPERLLACIGTILRGGNNQAH